MTAEDKIRCDRCGRREWKDCYGQVMDAGWLNVGYGANDVDLCPSCSLAFETWLKCDRDFDSQSHK